ncbi:MAG: hypothetical protein J1E84_04990 [Muribaculaceae bacterium]|nr:hypothetical protein [Muribaculaceae bacterium]
MKKLFLILNLLIVICLFIYWIIKSNGNAGNGESENKNQSNSEILNLSVIIDLSDRLTRDNVTPSQVYNDTAIVNYFVDYFIKFSKGQKNKNKCKNKFQILFYPTPKDQNINKLSRDLSVDLAKIKDKQSELNNMKTKIGQTLDVIYSKTMEDKKWEGSDIWDFFSNKQVDKLCIRQNCRNIVAILTDGYLYHVNHKIKEDNAYSYVLPQTLASGGSLISRRNDLGNVEVIMLEVNPYSPNERDPLIKVLKDWFMEMGLDENSISINETDVENRTEIIIENFLNQ